MRTHTNERPYPCEPCGFAFKTKSNLYKHRKSRTHNLKVEKGIDSSREEIMAELDEVDEAASHHQVSLIIYWFVNDASEYFAHCTLLYDEAQTRSHIFLMTKKK